MRWQVLLCVVIVLIIYLLIGAVVFNALEHRYDAQHNSHGNETHGSGDLCLMRLIKNELERKNQECVVPGSSTNSAIRAEASPSPIICLTKEQLLNIISNWTSICNQSIEDERARAHDLWDLPGSFFFAIAVVTTIGYGNLVPRSAASRAFCCIYAIFGIPLCLVAVVNIGAQLNATARLIETRLCRTLPGGQDCCGRAAQARALAIALVGAVVFILIPAAVFSELQNWDYGTSVYFAVVSLSTIGFGDYIAGITYAGKMQSLYRLMVGVWMFCGLSWLAGVLSSLESCFHFLAQKIDAIIPGNSGADHQPPDVTSSSSNNTSKRARETDAVVFVSTTCENQSLVDGMDCSAIETNQDAVIVM